MSERRQCTAKSKRTQVRCERPPIIGGTVCWQHGGAAPAVQRKAAERAALAELAAHMPALEHVDPSIRLAEALALCRQAVEYSRLRVGRDGVDVGVALDQLGQWLDRLARIAKAAHDAGISDRKVRVEEAQTALLAAALDNVLRGLGHDPSAPSVAAVVRRELLALDGAPA